VTLHLIERVVAEDEGAGDAVVCVHGLGGSANTWTAMMPALSRHRVLRVEMPGSARSWRAEGALSIERFVDVIGRFMERLNLQRAHWLGHSLGTIVCQHLAVRWPSRVRSLALFGPLLEPAEAARQGLRGRAERLRRDGIQGMHEVTEQLLQSALASETRQRDPLAVACVRDTLARSDPDGYARSCDALAGARAAPVEQIKAPVLLVTGDEDAVAPPQAVRMMAERMTAVSSVRTLVLPRCGHWTPIERPHDCARAWTEFVSAAARV
jgi:pimeloyl-ACP methyl ester carboxylesterase